MPNKKNQVRSYVYEHRKPDSTRFYFRVAIYEYNEEEHMRMEREDAFENGVAIGREQGLAAGHEEIVELISRMSADGKPQLNQGS